MENQAYLFAIFIFNGFLIGLIFDLFRVLRKSFKTKDWITYVQDMLFWIITTIIVLYSIFKFNNGELRGFIFIGISIGIIIYLLVFSKVFIKVNLFIINFAKKIIDFIVIRPIKILIKICKRIFFKPISFVIINFKKTLSNLKIKLKNLHNKNKKNEYRKDFM